MVQRVMRWNVIGWPASPRASRRSDSTAESSSARSSSIAYPRWITHSSLSGPQRVGPIGAITTILPVNGDHTQRSRTSGSLAIVEKSVET